MGVNKCKCNNGNPVTGDACKKHNANMCKSCKKGFALNPKKTGCAKQVWKSFNNFCVDKNGKDLPQTAWKNGAASNNKCKQECMKKKECTAYEWYQSGWGGSKCHLMLGKTASSKGHTGARWQDAKCFVKPAAKPTVNKCKCNNGKPVTGAACTKKNGNICKTCNVGFALTDKKLCAKKNGSTSVNKCKCKNGKPVTGAACTKKNANICKTCNDGFALNNKKACAKKQVNKCKCKNGKAVTGAACTKQNANICKSCKKGFALNAEKATCIKG